MNKQELLRSNVIQGISTQDDDLEKHRERLRKMADKQLLEQGRACRYMCTRIGGNRLRKVLSSTYGRHEPNGKEDTRNHRRRSRQVSGLTCIAVVSAANYVTR
jgi:hypothetical protein